MVFLSFADINMKFLLLLYYYMVVGGGGGLRQILKYVHLNSHGITLHI